MTTFVLVIASVMIISALAIKVYILFRYFKQKENETAFAETNSVLSAYKNLNEKGIVSSDQMEQLLSQYKKSESSQKLEEEKNALLKLKDLNILSPEEYNEKMFILEDLYKCGKI
ncbi:hypothetical protein [Clostridium manihotivorum]|uniref:Uncharacterized protein n=1 Tax=Clostridium manihotivorum TaxID=2320868 RepID=A0A410E0X0_9CLOT|nr:hypothetical protein [Clostridium manihotivorum]QAA34956.1 hypothetical protein C1I91_26775 [Clostridium manihotivorum]